MTVPRSVAQLLRPHVSRFSSASPASLLGSSWCPQCNRSLPSSQSPLKTSRRYLQTAHAYQPSSLPSEPLQQPPRNTGTSTANSLAGGKPQSFQRSAQKLGDLHTGNADSTVRSASTATQASTAAPTGTTGTAKTRKSRLRPRKAAMTLTQTAVDALHDLLDQPDPKLIRVGVKNRGCSGLAYHLEYVDKAGSFDETVEQDGVKVLIDSKALFSIIGSEMDWVEDKLSRRFVFKNPNITEQCGCGESFSIS